jgi:hypothetical protein
VSMSPYGDTDLREAFRTLGDEARQNAPPFSRLASTEALRARRQRRRWRRAAWAIVTAAIVIPSLLVLRVRTENALDYERFTARTGIDLGEVSWQAPSDFLFDVPTSDLLRTLPVPGRATSAPLPNSTQLPDASGPPHRS